MMHVCVVGGTGNISTAIVRLLLATGHRVTVFNRGLRPQRSELPDAVGRIEGDRQERDAFEAAMQAARFDAAIDMVCFTAEDARSTLRAFRGVKHLVYCSTVCTYGVDYDWLPVTEDHPARPITDYGRNKLAADRVFLEAWHREDFPVTILKPSTTYGPQWNLLRQVAWEATWVDRVLQGRPVAVCGDGRALHQWLYVEDAAPAFVHVIGRERCLGQTYNVARREFGAWFDYHRTAMQVIGREVELVGIPLHSLLAAKVPGVGICENIFSHNTVYCPGRLMRDVPEFRPCIPLAEGLSRVYAAMEREDRIPAAADSEWEDRLIDAQRRVGDAGIPTIP